MQAITVVHVLESLLILYFALYFLIETAMVAIFLLSWRSITRQTLPANDETDENRGISILVPAYNEEMTIVDVVKMLEQSDYPVFEIVVITDGCTDNTLEKLKEAFALQPTELEFHDTIGTSGVRGAYRSAASPLLTVADKPNGGKADALNVGLQLAKYPFVCTIDADSILDPRALRQVAAPFFAEGGEKVAFVGGALAVANGATFSRERFKTGDFPRNPWVIFQIVEYLRSFVVSRTGLSKIGALLVLSGAFTLFRRDVLLEAGGFLSPLNNHPYVRETGLDGKHTVCEDLEIVVRLRRYLKEHNRPVRVVFQPRPICWTEVPESPRNLSRQRNRWHRGLCETLYLHRSLLFEPSYGSLGLIAMPYYLIFEAISPLIKVLALFFIAGLMIFGLVNQVVMVLLLLAVALITAIFMSVVTVLVERWGRKYSRVNVSALRYQNDVDWITLLGMSILGDFTFSHLRTIWQIEGIWSFLHGRKTWDKFERKGFHEKD